MSTPAHVLIDAAVEAHRTELLELRRDLHAHPELSWHEQRTSDVVAARLELAGLTVTRPSQTGLVVDIGDGAGPLVALRADLDALPVEDLTTDPWVSTRPGVAHACGHDVHTAGLVGAGLALAELHRRGELPGRVRLLFQPAEEVMPGGATVLIDLGALDGVERIFCLHCDPTLDLGQVGVREGPITGAADQLEVQLIGSGGHTSRPHLTEDLTFALGKIITELPAVLSRRLDPRAGVSVVWGMVRAGAAPNVIPAAGVVGGTVRMLDAVAWSHAERLVREYIDDIVAPYGVKAEVDYRRGVPPVVNDPAATQVLGRRRRAGAGARRTGRHHPEPGRGGLRLVPRRHPRIHGSARHPDPRRADVRPPPGQPAGRRGRHPGRSPGAGHGRGRRADRSLIRLRSDPSSLARRRRRIAADR